MGTTAIPLVPFRHLLNCLRQAFRLSVLLQFRMAPAPSLLRRGIKVKFDIGIRKDHGANIAAFHHDSPSLPQFALYRQQTLTHRWLSRHFGGHLTHLRTTDVSGNVTL